MIKFLKKSYYLKKVRKMEVNNSRNIKKSKNHLESHKEVRNKRGSEFRWNPVSLAKDKKRINLSMMKKMRNINIRLMIKLILQHVLLPIRDNYLKGETEVQ